jgi:MFS transporter, CP family, cyanate transporter
MLGVGAVVASLIAVPVFKAAGNGPGWPVSLTLGLWVVPAVAAAVLWLPQVRYHTRPERVLRPAVAGVHRHALAWQVGMFMGLQSLSYYATLSWLPTLFRDRGVSAAAAGGLLALMNLGNALTAMVAPTVAHRVRDQRLIIAVTALAMAAGLLGSQYAPTGSAVAWALLLGFGQGASLGLAIFFTMARAPDPVIAASLSGFAQSTGYLIAAAGPLAVGFLHTATGGWTVPVLALLGALCLQLWAGLLAGREVTLPGG